MKEYLHPTDRKVHSLLVDTFHLTSLYPFQELVIKKILEQEGHYGEALVKPGVQSHLIILPTGSGKSVCFTLPAMLLSSITLIIYPLLSLLSDQKRRMEELGEHPVILKGGQSAQEREKLFEHLTQRDSHIILTTAEMLENQTIREKLHQLPISLVVIDEAHVIAQWGLTFRPSYLHLKEHILTLPCHQILAFTATSDSYITKVINDILSPRRKMDIIRGNIDRENIYYQVIPTLSKIHTLYQIVKDENFRPAIVFFRSRKGCEQISIELLKRLRAPIIRPYHAKLDPSERKKTEQWFFSHDGAILCATSAYGMGVDKKNIRCVIHWDLSHDVASFLQESGRGGRDGNPFYSITLLTQGENLEVEDDLQEIFIHSNRCRRERLLALMETPLDSCNGCDVCNQTYVEEPLGEREILKAIKLAPLRYTPSSIAHHLCGTTFKPIYIHSPFYKVLSTWTHEELLEAIQTLLKCGKLVKTAKNRLLVLNKKCSHTLSHLVRFKYRHSFMQE